MKNSLDCKKLLSYGKELSIFAGILLVLLFMFSCNNILMRNSGSLIIALPGARATTASLFTIELTGSNGTIPSEPLAGGTTVQFDDLAPDTYTINVKGMDDTGTIVLSGTAKATVVAGETETVTVDLQSSLGNLTVSFEGAESDSVAEYTVILSGPNESKETQEVTDRTVQFEGLIPGDYTVSVLGQDSAGTIVLSGTAKATVVEGQTVPATVPLQDKLGKLSVEFTVPDGSTATSYTVEITGANSVTQSKPVSDGTSVLFEGLIPGIYDITVEGMDDSNIVVLSGTEKATVTAGQTEPVTVLLQDKAAKLSVEFTVPNSSTAASYTVEITGVNSVPQSKNVAGDTSVQFDDLDPDTYKISVKGMDDTDIVVFYGTSSATVSAGANASAMVNLGGVATDRTSLVSAIESQKTDATIYVGGEIEVSYDLGVSCNANITFQAGYENVSIKHTGGTLFSVGYGYKVIVGGGDYTLTMDGSIISGGKNNTTAALKLHEVNRDTTIDLVSNGIVQNYGTGVSISGWSETQRAFFNLDGGIIKDNDIGIEVGENSVFTMTSGSIEGNTDKGVHVISDGTFNMSGGTITGGESSYGVYVEGGGTFAMSGNAIVDSSTSVYLAKDTFITISGSLNGAETVATITPNTTDGYAEGTQVLSAGDGVDLEAEVGKFKVTPESDGTEWTIVVTETDAGQVGQLQQVQ